MTNCYCFLASKVCKIASLSLSSQSQSTCSFNSSSDSSGYPIFIQCKASSLVFDVVNGSAYFKNSDIPLI